MVFLVANRVFETRLASSTTHRVLPNCSTGINGERLSIYLLVVPTGAPTATNGWKSSLCRIFQ